MLISVFISLKITVKII